MMNSPADCHGPVNIGNPNERTILELAELVIELTGSSSSIVPNHCPRTILLAASPISHWRPSVSAGPLRCLWRTASGKPRSTCPSWTCPSGSRLRPSGRLLRSKREVVRVSNAADWPTEQNTGKNILKYTEQMLLDPMRDGIMRNPVRNPNRRYGLKEPVDARQ